MDKRMLICTGGSSGVTLYSTLFDTGNDNTLLTYASETYNSGNYSLYFFYSSRYMYSNYDGSQVFKGGGSLDYVNLPTPYTPNSATVVNTFTFTPTNSDTIIASRVVDNGNKFVVLGRNTGTTPHSYYLYMYSLTSQNDVSAKSLTSTSSVVQINNDSVAIASIEMSHDGKSVFLQSNNNPEMYKVAVGTAWDMTTLGPVTELTNSFANISSSNHWFLDNGITYIKTSNATGNFTVYKLSTAYDLTTAEVWDGAYEVESGLYDGLLIFYGQASQAWFINAAGALYSVDFNGSYSDWQCSINQPKGVLASLPYVLGQGDYSGMFLNDKGTKMIVADDGNLVRALIEYDLSESFNPATAVESGNTFDVSTIGGETTNTAQALYVSPDGGMLFIGDQITQSVYKYSMSTPYDITTLSYESDSVSIGANIEDIEFTPDGLVMIVNGNYYTLSIAWDLSTVGPANSMGLGTVTGFKWFDDGNKCLVTDGTVYLDVYSCSTAYDVTTASSYATFAATAVAGGTGNRVGLWVANNGGQMIIVDTTLNIATITMYHGDTEI